MCVQNLDDSQSFAIRITYRISLRSSSLWEPRHPLLKVVPRYGILMLGWGSKPKFLAPETLNSWSLKSISRYLVGSHRFAVRRRGNWSRWVKVERRVTGCTTRGNSSAYASTLFALKEIMDLLGVVMILPQVHLRKPCYDFTFL